MFPSIRSMPQMFFSRQAVFFLVVFSCLGFRASAEEVPVAKPQAAETVVAEPRLRFNFRFQAWVDVLEWFAEQADLALVLDSPVPGTFNYTDANEYTPAEAIDLLNGVLLTKGHTLIRRDRMLMVVNLQDGIPEGMVPRVSLDELSKRGRFEMVSVLLPLGRRNVEEVNKEITPLLGPYGKCVSLAKTNQLLITDTAGILQAIESMIKSMPEPDEKKPSVKRPSNGKQQSPPTLAVYPLKTIDPSVAIEVLKSLLPDDKIVLDPKTKQINVFAVPAHQAVVKSVLQQMQANRLRGGSSPNDTVQIEVHHLTTLEPKAAIALLEKLLPDSQFAIDVDSRSLIALALPAEQAAIRATLAELQGDTAAGPAQLLFYPLDQPSPAGLIAGLRQLAPKAKITLEAGGKRLMVVAKASDHIKVAAAIKRLKENLPIEIPRFVVYPIVNADPAVVLSTLRGLLPDARLAIDPRTRRLLAWCSPAQHEQIKAAVEQMDSGKAEDAQDQLMVYPIPDVNPTIAMRVLGRILPGVQLHSDTRAGTIIASARESDHKIITQTLKAMQASEDLGQKQQFEVYSTGECDPALAISSIRGLVPKAQLVADPGRGQISAWATPKDQEKIRQALAKLAKREDIETAPVVATYRLGRLQPWPILHLVRSLAPRAQTAISADSRKIIVWARPADQKRIEQTFQKMQGDGSDDATAKVVVYQLESTPSRTATRMIAQAVPNAIVSIGADRRQLVVWALPAEHEKVKAVVDQLSEGSPAEKMVAYNLDTMTVSAAMSIIRQSVPQARLSVGATPRQLVVWARPADHAKIAATLAELSKEESASAAGLKIYTLESITPAVVIPILRQVAPHARVALGNDPQQLIVFASAADQEKVKTAIEQLSKSGSGQTASKAVVYKVGAVNAGRVIAGLRAIVPNARFTVGAEPNQLVAWARPADHEKIKLIVAEMSKNPPAKMVVYSLESTTAASAIRVLAGAFPNTRFAVGTDPRQLVAWASDEDHKRLGEAVEQMSKAHELETRVYYFRTADPRTAMTVLTALMPSAKMAVNAQNRSIAVTARPKDHEKIKAAVEQIDQEGDAAQALKLQAHQIHSADPAKLFAMLRTFFRNQPEIQLSLDDENETVMALASPRDHKKIQSLIAEVEKGSSSEFAPKVEVYSLKNVDSDAIEDVLDKLLKKDMAKVQLSFDSRSDQLVAIARPKYQEIIRETIGRMRTEEQTMEIYQLDVVDPSTATLAIDRLFSSSGYGYDPTAPVVDIDEDTQQMFVSATKAQHEKIHKLLVKMGETNLKTVDGKPKRTTAHGRNMAVYPLQNTDAVRVAAQLQKVLREMRPRWQRHQTRIMIVADDRLNAIIVKANRPDRSMIESIVRILDAPQSAESVQANRPTIINVKNTEASRVERVVREVFRAQLAVSTRPGGGSGRWSPRVSVDGTSNSLIVVAAPALLRQIEDLVQTLDAAAGDESARGMKIISLKKANASRVQKALDAAIQRAARRGRR